MRFRKTEAKEWAKANMVGVCGSLLPTFTSDLRSLNERAIRHDVRRLIEFGFWGALLISECGTKADEYIRFMEIAADAAGNELCLAAQNQPTTTDDTLKIYKTAEALGFEAALVGYPNTFRPSSEDEIFEYSQYLIEATDAAGLS